MKKPISITLLFAIMMANVLTSCSDVSLTKVTVTEKRNDFVEKTTKAIFSETNEYQAITPSGKTVVVEVQEEIALKKNLPYVALMRKSASSEIGMILLEDQEAWFKMEQ